MGYKKRFLYIYSKHWKNNILEIFSMFSVFVSSQILCATMGKFSLKNAFWMIYLLRKCIILFYINMIITKPGVTYTKQSFQISKNVIF